MAHVHIPQPNKCQPRQSQTVWRLILQLTLALAALTHPGCEAGALNADQQSYGIEDADVAILRDATKALRDEDLERPAVSERFVPSAGPPVLGFERGVVWLRLRLQRAADAPQTWYLEAGNPFINDIRLYTPTATGFTVAQAGDQFAYEDRALKFLRPVFALEFPTDGVQTFYLRMDSDSTLAGDMRVWQPAALRDSALQEMFYAGLAIGMVCMSLLMSIAHWFIVRERQVLLFGVLTVVVLCMASTGPGLVAPLLAPTWPALADLLVPWTLAIGAVATGLVFGHALHIRTEFPRLCGWLRLAYALALFAPLTRAFNQYNVWGGPMLQALYLLVVCGTGWASWMRWRVKAPGAVYFFAAHIGLFGVTLIGRLVALGWIQGNIHATVTWVPGLVAFLFLVHIGVFVQSKDLRRERDIAVGEVFTANEVLESERKLRAEQSVYFSFVAHELRSPLAAIALGIRNLETDLPQAPLAVRTRMQRIRANVANLAGLIDRHLTLQRLNSADFLPQFALVDPRLVAQEALVHVRGLFLDHTFSYACTDDVPNFVSADRGLLRMALDNLLINAAKNSPAASTIELQVTNDTALRFHISDRGGGIASEQLARMFDVFHQAHEAKVAGGFGIGLALVRRIADVHEGSLDYGDRAGGGAVFTLSLPLTR